MMETERKVIVLDASGWTEPLDVYEGLLAALRAPRWHGRNVNALIDSMIYGGINEVDLPYRIIVRGHDRASADVLNELTFIILALGEAGGCEGGIEFQVVPRLKVVVGNSSRA